MSEQIDLIREYLDAIRDPEKVSAAHGDFGAAAALAQPGGKGVRG